MEKTGKEKIVREDLYQFRFLSQAVLSPDGKRAAYVVNQPSEKKNAYESSIWVMDLETRANRLMAARGGAASPVWLDEKILLFTSKRESEAPGEGTKVFSISLEGGEAQLFMTIPLNGASITCLSDDLFLVNAAVTENDTAPEKAHVPAEEDFSAKEGKDYYILEELPFWSNGKGIISRKRQALYLFNRKEHTLARITKPNLDVVSFDISPDGSRIAFSGPVFDSIRPRTCGAFLYDIPSGRTTQLTAADQYAISNLCFLGESRVFFAGTSFERSGKHPRLYIINLENGEETQLPYLDFAIGNTVSSDARFGSGKNLKYCPERDVLYLIRTSWGNSQIMTLSTDGTLTWLTDTCGTVSCFDVKGSTMVMMAMRGNHLDELYLVDPTSGTEEKLTGFNDAYLESHLAVTPEEIRYDSRNGYRMNGYVIKPADYEPGKKYPAVLEIHGGPKTAFGGIFFHESQCLASDGYFVLLPNPRGSSGRSEAFADITEALGKEDVADIMEFLDQVLAACPDINEKKLGICGGSYGGFMCNWMVGHTDRFAAAVSQRSISNYLTKCLYTDNGYQSNRQQVGAYSWEDFQKVWANSPLSAARNVKTPLLLLQSDEDYRCYMGEAIQMFSAVKRNGTDVRMVLFHGENHEMSRSGKPQNRITRLEELENWFRKYF